MEFKKPSLLIFIPLLFHGFLIFSAYVVSDPLINDLPLTTTINIPPLVSIVPSLNGNLAISKVAKPLPSGGQWALLQQTIGISAMHMQVLSHNKVVIFDRTDFGPSNLSLPQGVCRHNPNDLAMKVDCTAHSVLYDIPTNTFRPLFVQTDTWCSSGGVNPDGTLVQTGGYNDGDTKIRTFKACEGEDEICDWFELPETLTNRRWYATNQVLPDGRMIVIGGRGVFTYEFVPKAPNSPLDFYLSFLKETKDPLEENNLYPFVHLLPDGNLFIFANKRSISFDYIHNRIVREFPVIPGEDKRNYPSTGSSVLLPLTFNGKGRKSLLPQAEVLICGGSPPNAFIMSDTKRVFVGASKTCGRIRVTAKKPKWVIEEMPMPRVMPDMVLLPTGDVLIINGAMNGTAGWEDAINPVVNPVLYKPNEANPTRRFEILNPNTIPRMYHSSALLLPDGRVLVGGSNPHALYNFTAEYPTQLKLEAFSPFHLSPQFNLIRPAVVNVESLGNVVSYKQTFSIKFSLHVTRLHPRVNVVLIWPSFTTHSFGMNQRMLNLEVVGLEKLQAFTYKVTVKAPPTNTVAPPGHYMLFLVHMGIPGNAVWVKVQ